MKRGLRTFARRMATRPGRLREISSEGKMDFRRTLRSSLKSGGHMMDLRLVRPKISKSNLVFLCDVSGSMDAFSDKILRLLHYTSNTVRGTDVYAFSTQLVSLNKYIRGKSLSEATRLVSKNVDIWGSGTRIGTALGLLFSKYPGALRQSTVLVIISDGWELGDLELFRMRLGEVKRHVAKLVWFNPQADSPDFSPISAGMKSALPFVDFFSGLGVFWDRVQFEGAFGKAMYRVTK